MRNEHIIIFYYIIYYFLLFAFFHGMGKYSMVNTSYIFKHAYVKINCTNVTYECNFTTTIQLHPPLPTRSCFFVIYSYSKLSKPVILNGGHWVDMCI